MRLGIIALASLLFATASSAFASAPPISQSIAVCDPNTSGSGLACVRPNADGSINVTGGGGGGSAPSATVGSAAATTSSPISGSDGATERRVLLDSSGRTVVVGNETVVGPQTAGSAATGGGLRAMFKTTAGNAVDPLTDTTGAIIPPQATPSTGTILSLSASTATQLRAVSTGSRGATIRTESANTAPIYVCYVATTTCSATVHDDVIPVSSAVGALLIPLYPVTSTIYVYSTAATSLSVTDWASK